MKCPYCKSENDKVLDSRSINESTVIRRRRECESCGRRFTTYERIEEVPIFIVKKDQRREPYDRQKILTGIYKACEKTSVPLAKQDEIADSLECMIRDEYDKEIPTRAVGEFIMRRLAALDQVAYVRFASVYREFQDVSHFMEELKGLINTSKK